MPDKKILKRYFIIAVITSLVVSAGMGIFALLFGAFGYIEWRILGSTLTIGVFSITSLASLRNIESDNPYYRAFAKLSIAFSIFGMLLSLIMLWADFGMDLGKPSLVFLILAVSTAHASLLLPFRSKESSPLNIALFFTLVCISVVAGFLIYLILSSRFSDGEFLYRLIGVFAILDVLGTIVVPVLGRLGHKGTSPPSIGTSNPAPKQ